MQFEHQIVQIFRTSPKYKQKFCIWELFLLKIWYSKFFCLAWNHLQTWCTFVSSVGLLTNLWMHNFDFVTISMWTIHRAGYFLSSTSKFRYEMVKWLFQHSQYVLLLWNSAVNSFWADVFVHASFSRSSHSF